MTRAEPLVSCLLVTLPTPERLALIRTSIDDYCKQTHENRELVIVMDDAPEDARDRLRKQLDALSRKDIRIVESEKERTLGALRNLSFRHARGDVLCQWDDDDRHHPRRIEAQLAELESTGASAVLLQEAFHLFQGTGELYWTNWRATEPKSLPGTILWRAGVDLEYPERGPDASIEDHVFCMSLLERGEAACLAGQPHLYVYIYHGTNFRTVEHHRMLAAKLSISRRLLERREDQIRDGLAPFGFGDPPLTVVGSNGPAFTLTRSE